MPQSNAILVNNIEASILARLDALQLTFSKYLQLQAQINPLAGEHLQKLHEEFVKSLQKAEQDSRDMLLEGHGVLSIHRKRTEDANLRPAETLIDYSHLSKHSDEGVREHLESGDVQELLSALVETPEATEGESVNPLSELATRELTELEDYTTATHSEVFKGSLSGGNSKNGLVLVLVTSAHSRIVHDLSSGAEVYFSFAGKEGIWVNHTQPKYISYKAMYRELNKLTKALQPKLEAPQTEVDDEESEDHGQVDVSVLYDPIQAILVRLDRGATHAYGSDSIQHTFDEESNKDYLLFTFNDAATNLALLNPQLVVRCVDNGTVSDVELVTDVEGKPDMAKSTSWEHLSPEQQQFLKDAVMTFAVMIKGNFGQRIKALS